MGRGIGQSGRKGAFALGACGCMLQWMCGGWFLAWISGAGNMPVDGGDEEKCAHEMRQVKYMLGNHGHLPYVGASKWPELKSIFEKETNIQTGI